MTIATHYESSEFAAADAVNRLYDAECALHAAQESRVGAWIEAAAARLHAAVLELEKCGYWAT